MTDKQEQALATSEEQQSKAPELEQATKEPSPAEQLRTAMGHNFLQHCVNARVAECEQAGSNPLMVGGADAVATIIGQTLNAAGQDGVEQQLAAVLKAVSLITVSGVPLGVHITRGVIGQAAEQGSAFALLGELQGFAVSVTMQAAMNGVYSAVMEKVEGAEQAANPMAPFPANAEAIPAVDQHEQHIEEMAAAAVAKDEAGNANYTSAEEAKQVMGNRKQASRQNAKRRQRR